MSHGVGKSVRGDVSSFWMDMVNSGEMPQPWGQTGFTRRDQFRKTLEGKYPWLRLCEGHWKVNQLWVNYFTRWKNRFPSPLLKSKGKARADPGDEDDIPVIEIDTSDSGGSVGSKRGREDTMDPMPPKKAKVKQEGMSIPRHARPRPTKTSAKVAKVSILSILSNEHLLKDV